MPDFGIFRGFNDKLFGDKLYAGQLPINLGLIGSEAFGFDPDYQAVLNYASAQGYTLPSESQQILQNQLVVDLKNAGIWSKLDTFAVFATDGDSDFALIDWIRLTDYTAVNSPTFTTNVGFQGDGTSSYIESNYLPVTNAVNLSQNSNSYGYIMSQYDTAPISAEQHWGNAISTSAQGFWRSRTASNTYHNATDVLFITGKSFTTNVLLHMDRISSSTVYDIVDGTVENTIASISALVLDQEFIAMKFQSNYSDVQLQVLFAGASIYNERVDFNNLLKNYLSEI
jgi:hypothetical protein